jgi:hypothetical protein
LFVCDSSVDEDVDGDNFDVDHGDVEHDVDLDVAVQLNVIVQLDTL